MMLPATCDNRKLSNLLLGRAVVNDALGGGQQGVEADVGVEQHGDHLQGHGAEGRHFSPLPPVTHQPCQQFPQGGHHVQLQEGSLPMFGFSATH